MSEPFLSRESTVLSDASAEPHRSPSAFWTFYLPIFLFALVVGWWRFGPIVPGTALAGCATALVILLARAGRSSQKERVVWLTITVAFFVAESCFAYRVHALAQSFIVGHLQNNDVLSLEFKGGHMVLPAVSLFVMDLEGMRRLQAARVEDSARYKLLIQDVKLGNFGSGSHVEVPIREVQKVGQAQYYRLVFYSKQTMWWEDLQVLNEGGQRSEAYRVISYRGLHPRVLTAYQDPNFHLDAPHGPDWTWATQEP